MGWLGVSLAWDPIRRTIFVATSIGRVKMFNLAHDISSVKEYPRSLHFDTYAVIKVIKVFFNEADDFLLAVTSNAKLLVHDFSVGKSCVFYIQGVNFVNCVAFDQKNHILMCGRTTSAVTIHTLNGNLVRTLKVSGTPQHMIFDPSNSQLTVASHDQRITIFRISAQYLRITTPKITSFDFTTPLVGKAAKLTVSVLGLCGNPKYFLSGIGKNIYIWPSNAYHPPISSETVSLDVPSSATKKGEEEAEHSSDGEDASFSTVPLDEQEQAKDEEQEGAETEKKEDGKSGSTSFDTGTEGDSKVNPASVCPEAHEYPIRTIYWVPERKVLLTAGARIKLWTVDAKYRSPSIGSVDSEDEAGEGTSQTPGNVTRGAYTFPTPVSVSLLEESMRESVREGNSDGVRRLLRQGVSCRSQDRYGNSALHIACLQGNGYLVQLLLTEGSADLHLTNHLGKTPTHMVSSSQCLSALLAVGGPTLLYALDNSSRTPLHYISALTAPVSVTKTSAAQQPDNATAEKDTPADKNAAPVVSIAASAASASPSAVGIGPLSITIDGEDNAAEKQADLQKLIESAVQNCTEMTINAADASQATPLHYAVSACRADAVVSLCRAHALCNVQEEGTLFTPLHIAVIQGKQDLVAELLNEGENIDPNIQDSLGNTPLHYACETANIEIVKLLMRGSNRILCYPDIPNKKGEVAAALATADTVKQWVVQNTRSRPEGWSDTQERMLETVQDKLKEWKEMLEVELKKEAVAIKQSRERLEAGRGDSSSDARLLRTKLYCNVDELKLQGFTVSEIRELKSIHESALANLQQLLDDSKEKEQADSDHDIVED
eukprot:TRINITY_DN11714_c0_g1_i2.p1 TRINITY_DN11714_c0_g1~~TRINITY_DN11714_c0_g1_i2.p1  ORF type:complete len:967 (-),score=196.34 TRINITY_DN11714_c0_g1_i2:122-2614(-)